MKRALGFTVLIIVLSAGVLPAHAFVIHKTSNGSRCLLPDSTHIYYYAPPTIDQNAAFLAAEEWNDAPVMVGFIFSGQSPTVYIRSVGNNESYFQRADAITYTAGNPDHLPTCSNEYVQLPLYVDVNDVQLAHDLQYYKSLGYDWNDQDFRATTIAHELGHVLGLGHSQVVCSLMWGGGPPNYNDAVRRLSDPQCSGGVWFPVIDDIKGAASLYGWTRDTSFQNVASSGSVYISTNPGNAPPAELEVMHSKSGTYVQLYNNTSLPSSKIAIMMMYVTPKTLYRFGMGWQQGTNSPPNQPFASLELDNDGAKFVSAGTTQNIPNSDGPIAATLSYFLELVVEYDSSSCVVRTHSYVFRVSQSVLPMGTIELGNGNETLQGHWSGDVSTCVLLVCHNNSWSDARSFFIGVWTDSNTNPASDYKVDHFWNYQGNKPLVPPPDFAAGAFGPYFLDPGEYVQGAPGFMLEGLNGFAGAVNLAQPPSDPELTVTLSSTSVNVLSNQDTFVWADLNAGYTSGTFSITVTMTNDAFELSHSATLVVNICPGCSWGGGGGDGGSVAPGTLITLADGSRVPVQNLQVGTQLLSYDMNSLQYVNVTITNFTSVATHNQMVIQAGPGQPLIVDQNPAQKVYTMLPNGTWTLMSVTDLQVGYSLFDASNLSWIPITGIRYENSGIHMMYDIYTTAPFDYIANNYLDPVK